MCFLGGALAPTVLANSQPPELLSQLMQKLSSTPEFRERMLSAVRSVPKIGEWLSPEMVDRLRSAILGKDWQRVDHFPGITLNELNHSVDLATHVAGKSDKTPSIKELIDLGDYSLDRPETVRLDQPATKPTCAEDPDTAVSHPAAGITMGDGPDPNLAPMHAESKLVAEVLNRLSLNSPHAPQLTALFAGRSITDPGTLIAVLQRSGHQVRVDDDLFFANFGHLHDGARDVMMPFWLDTQIEIPGTRRSLLLPVNHSEHELHIRGPIVNVDISYYFGIDGKSEFRTMDSLNQSWVLGRSVFVYTGDGAVEVINLLSQASRVYLALHQLHPELPFHGYYKLGVCQDINAAVEEQMQGRTILFPLTRDPNYFPTEPQSLHLEARDRQFLQLMARIPSDRSHGKPDVSRVLGSLPMSDISDITIPGLAEDLRSIQRESLFERVKRTPSRLRRLVIAAMLLGVFAWATYSFRRRLSARF